MSSGVKEIALAVCLQRNVAVLLWGNPGVGKTSVIGQLASDYNMHLEVVIASIREPSDFNGLPYIVDGEVRFAPPAWGKEIVRAHERGQSSITFYDEISTAPPSVQSALLRPILEKQVGDLLLPSSNRTIAAANPPEIASNGYELTPPLANRFTHLDWDVNAQDVASGFERGWGTIESPVFPNGESMLRAEQHARIIVASFLRARPELVEVVPENLGVSDTGKFRGHSYAFVSPRSWETAAKIYAATKSGILPASRKRIPAAVLNTLLYGTIGRDVSIEFLNYIKTLDLPDPNQLLDGTATFDLPQRADQAYALLSSLEYAYSLKPEEKRWHNYGEAITKIVENTTFADVAFQYAKSWYASRPPTIQNVDVSKMRAFAPILNILESA